MRLLFALLLLTAMVAPGTCLASQILETMDLEGYFSSGNTDNLLQDSSNFKETYTTAGATAKFYPLKMSEITLTGEYNKYSELNTLSNFRYRSELKLIPTSDSSNLSVFLFGAYDGRNYKADNLGVNTADFNKLSVEGVAALGYTISPIFHLRGGMSYHLTGYDNVKVEDKYTIDYFAGVNKTVFGNTSFDFEAGLTSGNLEYTPRSVKHVGPVQLGWQQGGGLDTSYTVYDSLKHGTLSSFYLSPRISRSIGARTGVSLTLAYRKFITNVDSTVVFGYSTGILSPWVADYEGEAALLNIKSFLIPRLITTVTLGYWRRVHLPTAEQAWLVQSGLEPVAKAWQEPNTAQDRVDIRRRMLVQMQMPIASRSGWFFEPYISLEYSNNNSSIAVYEFDNFVFTGGVTIRL